MPSVFNPFTSRYQDVDERTYRELRPSPRDGRQVFNPVSGRYATLSPEDEAIFFPTPDRRPDPRYAPNESDGVGLADFGKSVMAGGASVVAGLGWLVDKLDGESGVGEAIEDLGRDAVDYWNDSLSDAAKDELSKEFITHTEEDGYEWGDASLATVGLFGAQSLLGTAAGAGVGAGLTKVLQIFGNPAGRAVLQRAAQAGSRARPGTRAAAMGQQAARKLKIVDRLIGAAGFGAGEGLIGGTATGFNVQEQIMNLPDETLYENERFREIYDSTDSLMSRDEAWEYAKQTLADEASTTAGWQAGLTTALLGAPMGAYFGPLFSKVGTGTAGHIGMGAAGEAAQEFLQSGAEEAIANRAVGKATWEGVLNAAVGGALAGAPLGGVLATADRGQARAGEKKAERTDREKVVVDGVNYAPLINRGRQAKAAGASDEEIQAIVESARESGKLPSALKAMRDLIKAKQEATETQEIPESAKTDVPDVPDAERPTERPQEARSQPEPTVPLDEESEPGARPGAQQATAPAAGVTAEAAEGTREAAEAGARQEEVAEAAGQTVEALPDSALVTVAESSMPDGDAIPLNRFTPDESDVLRSAGLVSEAESPTGERYEGVEPRPLFEERDRRFEQRRASSGTKVGSSSERSDEGVVSTPDDLNTVVQDAATSPENERPEPTEAQKSAGNYRKPKVRLPERPPIRIENPMGSTRAGTRDDGTEWSRTLEGVHYGYFTETTGADDEGDGPREGVDVFVGPNATDASLPAFVIDQKNPDGSFDEHKIVLGFKTEKEARAAYQAQYDEGWDGIGAITAMSTDQLREFLRDEARTAAPVSYRPPEPTVEADALLSENSDTRDSSTESATSESEPAPETRFDRTDRQRPSRWVTGPGGDSYRVFTDVEYADGSRDVTVEHPDGRTVTQVTIGAGESFDEAARLVGQQPEESADVEYLDRDAIKPNKNRLSDEEREVEKRFADYLTSTPWSEIVAQYKALDGTNAPENTQDGRIISTDAFRELSEDYRESRRWANAVQEPASAAAKKYYAQRLTEAVPAGREPEVLMTAGGTGAGKTSGLRLSAASDEAHIILDGNLANLASAKRKVRQALDANHRVTVNYVYNEPLKAFRGTLDRARRMEEKRGSGRVVPIAVHASTHAGSEQTARGLIEEFGEDRGVRIEVVDNSGAKGEERSIPIEDVPALAYNEIADEARRILENERPNLSEAIYRSVLGEGTEQVPSPGTEAAEPVPGQPAQDEGGARPRGAGESAAEDEEGLTDERAPVQPGPRPLEGVRRSGLGEDSESDAGPSASVLESGTEQVPSEGAAGGEELPEVPQQDRARTRQAAERAEAGLETEDAEPAAEPPTETPDDDAAGFSRRQAPVSGQIEDFGEVLEGARKHLWEAYRDRLREAGELDTAAQPLSKSWPQPDYRRLIDDGADPWVVAFIRAARDEIPTKPRKPWKRKEWVKQVEALRNFSEQALDGRIPPERIREGLDQHPVFRSFADRVELYAAVGHAKSLKGVRIAVGQYSMLNGEKIDPPRTLWTIERAAKATAFGNWPTQLAEGNTRAAAIANFKRDFATIDTQPRAARQVRFTIYSYRTGPKAGRWIIGKKVGKDRVDLREFDSVKEARSYLDEHHDELVEAFDRWKAIPAHRKESDAPRVGAEHRHGADITPETFAETFGFRGVQFGNYVEGGRRQEDLNRAYDALLDLAGLLDVPARALSLNGELGLAFGARGKGGKRAARAHYEPDTIVINLTKREGAGSLAHEWWHALDNYFSRRRGNRPGYVSEDAQAGRPPGSEGIRPEVLDAFVELGKAINKTSLRQRSRGLDRRRTKPYWSMGREMSARAFESYVVAKLQDQGASNDYLANIVSEDYWKAAAALGVGEGTETQPDYPYPTAAEIPAIRAGFDALFDTIETRATDEDTVELFSRAQETGLSGRTAEQVRDQLASAIGAVQPLLDVQVVQSVDDLPPDARGSDVEGAYYRSGRVYLVADNLTEARAPEVFMHEVFGHAAMERHPDFPKWVTQIQNAKKAKGGTIAKLAAEVASSQGLLDATTEAKEIIALMAERDVKNGLLDKIIATFRRFFRSIGLLRDVSDAEIRAWLAKGARQFMADAEIAARVPGGAVEMPAADDTLDQAMFSRAADVEDRAVGDDSWAGVLNAAVGGDLEGAMGPPRSDNQLNRFLDEAIFRFQDKFNYLYQAQKAAARERGLEQLPEAEDVYLAELRYHGMAGAAVEDFQREHVEPLVEAISKSGLTVEDVDRYLHARHAPEANAQLQRINPDREDNEALSGMSDAEAAAVIDGFRDAGTLADFEAIAMRIDAITKAQRDLMVESGLESAETIEEWEETYEHYVPLHREGFDGRPPTRGEGFSVTDRQKRRAGSQRPVAHIVAQVVAQQEATIIRAQKNKVAQAMLEFATNNPNPDLYEVDKVEFQASFGADGLVTYRPQRGFQFADSVLVVKVDGGDHTVTFNPRNHHSQRIGHAMKGLGSDHSGPILNALSKVMRYLALVNTGANPEFIISNFTRDLQTAGYNLSSTEADKLKWTIIKDVGKAWRGIRAFQQGKHHAWASNFDEFRKAGAQTGWLGLYNDVAQREGALVKKIEELSGESSLLKIKAGMRAVIDFIERENTAVENAIRLSAFVHGRRAGMSEGQAARLAKELTVNFNRKGDYGQVMNALYLFYNASIQGSARIIAAAGRSPKVRKLIGATVVAAMFLDMLNRELGGDDEDDEARYDKIPDYVKERNLIIMRPGGGGDFIKIPLPWGYNVFHVLGQVMGEGLTKRNFKPTEGAFRVADAVFGAFNPIGGEASVAQKISPTITDPIVQWSENKDWAGRPLRPERNPFDVDKPDSQKYWNSVREPSRWVTEKLNELTGGSEIRPGAIDISPEWIDLMIDTFTGGAGRFVSDTLSTPVKAIQGDDIESYEIPLLRKLYGRPGMGTLFRDYYRNADAVRITEKEARHFMETRDRDALKKLRRERPGEYALIRARRTIESQLRKLRQRRNRVEASKLPEGLKRTQLKNINEQIEERMHRFNRLYNQRVGE